MFDFLRNLTKSDEEKQQERLSAYLDNALTPDERAAFEEELKADTALQASLERDRAIKQNLSALPRMRAPRNFTLDPAVYGRPTSGTVFRLYPVMRTATALAAVMIIFLFSLELLSVSGGRADNMASAPESAAETFDVVANAQDSEAEEVTIQTEAEAVEEMEADIAEAPMEEPAQEPPAVFEGEAVAEEAADEEMVVSEEQAGEEETAESLEESTGDSDPNVAPEPAVGLAGGATEGDGTTAIVPRESTTGTNAVVAPTITATQGLSQTEQASGETKGLDSISTTLTYGVDNQADEEQGYSSTNNSASPNRFLLPGSMVILFLVLLAGTLYLRRQL